MLEFPWDAVIEPLVGNQSVVAVVGESLLVVEVDGRKVKLSDLLAERLRARVGLPPNLVGAPLADVMTALGHSGRRARMELHQVHKDVLRELIERSALPTPLLSLAKIRDLHLFVSTTNDGLLEAALRHEGRTDVESFSPSRTPESVQSGLLKRTGTTVVHAFGSISAAGDFALGEEDLLELVCDLQGAKRPEALLGMLAQRHLLFIGTGFPDWLARLFIRILRGQRLSNRSDFNQALAEPYDDAQKSLVAFLNASSPQTFIYDGGDVAGFVDELHRRWQEARASESSRVSHGEHVSEPEPMERGSVFISYSRAQDSAAAQRIWERLSPHMDVWYDRRKIDVGDPWWWKIQANIDACDLFLPVLSTETAARTEGVFIEEWNWALRRNGRIKDRRFIVPYVVDNLSDRQYPRHFDSLHIDRASGGNLSDEQVRHLVDLLRQVRTLRR